MIRHPLLLILSALGLLLLLAPFLALTARPGARANQSNSTIDLVAIDAVPEGNTATSLGEIDPCARTELGSDIDVDVVVDSIPEDRPIIAFQIHVLYDPQILEVVAVDNDQLLTAGPGSSLFEVSEATPDADGDFKAAALDVNTGLPTNTPESGPGVLFRITLRPKASGTADLAVAADPPNTYPGVIDDQNEPILVNQVSAATIAVGQDCPSTPAQPPVTAVPTAPPREETPATTQGTPSRPDLSPIPPSAGPGTPDLRTPSVQATATARAVIAAEGTPGRPDLSPTPPSAGPGTPDLRTPSVQATATARATATAAAIAAEAEQNGDSDGAPTALIVVLATLGLTAAAGGGWALYRRRKGRA